MVDCKHYSSHRQVECGQCFPLALSAQLAVSHQSSRRRYSASEARTLLRTIMCEGGQNKLYLVPSQGPRFVDPKVVRDKSMPRPDFLAACATCGESIELGRGICAVPHQPDYSRPVSIKMSVARPSQCLFCVFTRTVRQTPAVRRKFHASATQQARKPKHPSIKAEDLPVYTKMEASGERPDYSKHYSPEQVAAIEAAEQTMSGSAVNNQSKRTDPWSVNYIDDFTNIDPVVDKPVRAPWTNIDQKSRLKTEDELAEDWVKFMQNLPPENSDAAEDAFINFDRQLRLTVGEEAAELRPRTALAPDIPKLSESKKPKKAGKKPGENPEEDEPSPALVRLMQMTGYDRRQISQLRVKSIISHRVSNQTRLGKIHKMYFLSIAGNGNGLIGIGEGKAEEPAEARLQSQYRAIRNMQPIMRYENRTIFGDVSGKVSATELELYARPPGKLG